MKATASFAALAAALSMITLAAPRASADCPLAHTHIGVNPTWRPDWSDPGNPDLATDQDETDNDQLWFFSIPPVDALAPTPGWPNWGDPAADPFLRLVEETGPGGDPITKPGEENKTLYACRFMWSQENGYGDPDGKLHLDGWHSAHGPQGVWNLESIDEETEPAWDIGLQRQSTSMIDPTDFVMLRPDDTVVLGADGATFTFSDYGEKMWLADKNAWGIHSHMGFRFWLDDPQLDDVFTATFTAFDDGGMYTESDPFTFRFAVPEPGTLSLLALAGLFVVGRRR